MTVSPEMVTASIFMIQKARDGAYPAFKVRSRVMISHIAVSFRPGSTTCWSQADGISTTAEALASTRIMPSCMALGQAAGVAASMSADRKLAPRKLDVKSIQTILRGNGALI